MKVPKTGPSSAQNAMSETVCSSSADEGRTPRYRSRLIFGEHSYAGRHVDREIRGRSWYRDELGNRARIIKAWD
jgi:hypothetical protein